MGRLFVVSQRVARPGDVPAAGGLAIALAPVVARHGATWLGADSFSNLIPPAVSHGHATWSNTVLWPALHGLDTGELADSTGRVAYRAYNRLVARALAPRLRDGDRVWIHDFQLLTLGAELRRVGVRARLGFFLHVPLPGRLTQVPGARALLRALLACNSVGFQTDADLAVFHDAAAAGRAECFASAVSVDLHALPCSASVGSDDADAPPFALGVDRLDPSKGLPQRLAAAAAWLADTPAWRFRQIAAPSRTRLPAHRALADHLRRAAGTECRIDLVEHCLPHAEVLAAMSRARIGCVTPLRDGMNLVAKEYVAAQNDADPGVLILSRTAGAARELEAALLVDANDPAAIAAALATASRMPISERRNRQESLRAAIARHTLDDWACDCLERLTGQTTATAAWPATTSPISA